MENIKKSELLNWLAFYLCKGLGVGTLIRLQDKLQLSQLTSKSYNQLLELGLTARISTNLINTNWAYINQIINSILEQKNRSALLF
jgi:DNA processing protein